MYSEFYKLRGEPFLLTPDQRFYFESNVHSQAMAHLTYGLSRGEGFIVITGEIGAGKTTLVRKLCTQIDSQRIVVAHVVTTLLDGSNLLRMVAAAFGIVDLPTEKSAVLLRLQNFFEEAYRDNRRALLIVDEAQNLTVEALEELRMLSNFQIGSAAPFQSFLIAQPQFRTMLANPNLEQLRQRVIAVYHLGPMSREECGDYLCHRLSQVGWQNDPHFYPSALEAIFDHTDGVPRRINTLCNRLMLFGFLDDLHRFTADEVEKVAADLAREGASKAHSPVLRPASDDSSAVMPPSLAAGDGALELMAELEKRVAHQETFIRRLALAVDDFLKPSRSEQR